MRKAAARLRRITDLVRSDQPTIMEPREPTAPRTPQEALRALIDGNERYASGKRRTVDYNRLGDRIAETQRPFAAIIACADSRVSVSAIFDLAPGHVFVSRVAGNSVDRAVLGSTEFAVAELGVQLVMVLGHGDCGAVKAAIAAANGELSFPPEQFGAIGAVVNAVLGPVKALPPNERTLECAISANAAAHARRVAATEPIIAPAVNAGRVSVVAAVYDIRTRRVSVL